MPAVSYELVQTIGIGTCSTAELVFVIVSRGLAYLRISIHFAISL